MRYRADAFISSYRKPTLVHKDLVRYFSEAKIKPVDFKVSQNIRGTLNFKGLFTANTSRTKVKTILKKIGDLEWFATTSGKLGQSL